MILVRGFKSVISTSRGMAKELMLCWHVVSCAKLLERDTNAHRYTLCEHVQPSSTGRQK